MKIFLKGRFFILASVFLAFSLFSCQDGDMSQGRRDVIGDVGDVVFVVESRLWNTALKDTVDYYFQSPFLLLPQPEPVFDVKHFTMNQILSRPIRKKFRTMVLLANMSELDTKEAKMAIKDLGRERVDELLTNPEMGFATGKSKWADEQLIVYVLANSQEDLERSIIRNFPKIAAKIRQHDQPRRHERAFHNGHNKPAEKMLKDTFGIEMEIPSDYITSAVRNENLIWMRKETPKLSSSILVGKIPYRRESQLNADSLQVYLNAFGRKYIASSADSSYFVINDHDLPLIKSKVNLNGHYAVENRGIWELERDFMGGPFISYLLQNPNKADQLLLVAGFVYAPQKKKKVFMEHLEEIIRTVK